MVSGQLRANNFLAPKSYIICHSHKRHNQWRQSTQRDSRISRLFYGVVTASTATTWPATLMGLSGKPGNSLSNVQPKLWMSHDSNQREAGIRKMQLQSPRPVPRLNRPPSGPGERPGAPGRAGFPKAPGSDGARVENWPGNCATSRSHAMLPPRTNDRFRHSSCCSCSRVVSTANRQTSSATYRRRTASFESNSVDVVSV